MLHPPATKLQSARTLRLLLGDQLNADHSWWQEAPGDVVTVLMESRQETDYARHHVQKVVAFFLAMRSFATERIAEGHNLHYLPIDAPTANRPMMDVLRELVQASGATEVRFQAPDEWRLDELFRSAMNTWPSELGVSVCMDNTEHFLTDRNDLAEHFKGKKQYLMESFCDDAEAPRCAARQCRSTGRGQVELRRQQPKKLPKGHCLPRAPLWERDVTALLADLETAGVKTVGRVDAARFGWPVTRDEGLALLDILGGVAAAIWGFSRRIDRRQLDRVPQPIEFRHECQASAPARSDCRR